MSKRNGGRTTQAVSASGQSDNKAAPLNPPMLLAKNYVVAFRASL